MQINKSIESQYSSDPFTQVFEKFARAAEGKRRKTPTMAYVSITLKFSKEMQAKCGIGIKEHCVSLDECTKTETK